MKLFTPDDTTPHARAMWARSIARLLAELERPQSLVRAANRLYRREVAGACAPSLTEIRWVLVDDAATVRPETMRRLRTFLTDGARSPLYHDDPELARRTAHELAVAFVVFAGMHAAPAPAPVAEPEREPLAAGRA
ncbi:MAG: hypothetical protein QOH15_3184 [Gaiellales bacterium]|jgi:hypothetical protein|nr:hypothetical protein [Gaiellales bacterium]